MVAELDDDAIVALCDELAREPRTVTCELYGYRYDIEITSDNCIDELSLLPDGCPITVGDARACNDAVYTSTVYTICSGDGLPAACALETNEACLPATPTGD